MPRKNGAGECYLIGSMQKQVSQWAPRHTLSNCSMAASAKSGASVRMPASKFRRLPLFMPMPAFEQLCEKSQKRSGGTAHLDVQVFDVRRHLGKHLVVVCYVGDEFCCSGVKGCGMQRWVFCVARDSDLDRICITLDYYRDGRFKISKNIGV